MRRKKHYLQFTSCEQSQLDKVKAKINNPLITAHANNRYQKRDIVVLGSWATIIDYMRTGAVVEYSRYKSDSRVLIRKKIGDTFLYVSYSITTNRVITIFSNKNSKGAYLLKINKHQYNKNLNLVVPRGTT